MEKKLAFFLGGHDLEMQTIAKLLEERGVAFFDKKLAWGAKASQYLSEIAEVDSSGGTAVLVELEIDIELPQGTIVVDHHGERAQEDASILQVMKLLEVEPTREDLLVAANDCSYIPGMIAMGAKRAEIEEIRQRDRAAQGVTAEDEVSALSAIEGCLMRNGVLIVTLPHTRFSAVTDRLFFDWPDGKENLVVVGKKRDGTFEVGYFGRGDICLAMKTKFEGWGGGKGYGNAEMSAFAGCNTDNPTKVIDFVVDSQ